MYSLPPLTFRTVENGLTISLTSSFCYGSHCSNPKKTSFNETIGPTRERKRDPPSIKNPVDDFEPSEKLPNFPYIKIKGKYGNSNLSFCTNTKYKKLVHLLRSLLNSLVQILRYPLFLLRFFCLLFRKRFGL